MAKLEGWVAKWVAHPCLVLATAALWFESRHLPKMQNGQHKQRSGQHTLARQKNKKRQYLIVPFFEDWEDILYIRVEELIILWRGKVGGCTEHSCQRLEYRLWLASKARVPALFGVFPSSAGGGVTLLQANVNSSGHSQMYFPFNFKFLCQFPPNSFPSTYPPHSYPNILFIPCIPIITFRSFSWLTPLRFPFIIFHSAFCIFLIIPNL